MKAPAFWNRPPDAPGIIARLLGPVSFVAKSLSARRVARPATTRPDVPVICVGNINIGGTGKTPTVIAIVQHYQSLGLKPFVISRGYGGHVTTATEVDANRHNAGDVGDEPLLLAAFTRVWVSPDRGQAAKAAEAAGADLLIMDDWFQNPDVAKDFSMVVVDAEIGFGNGRVFPAGPLREPIEAGLKRADMVVSIGARPAQDRFCDLWPLPDGMATAKAQLVPLPMGLDWSDQNVLAFAGIGRPEKFFATLRALGANLVQTVSLDDHQPLTPALLQRMARDAKSNGAQLVTTEKDAVRLPADMRTEVLTLPVRLEFSDPAILGHLPEPKS